MTRPPDRLNFCRVFELPEHYPAGYCFNGGHPVSMLLVDRFHPWPTPGFSDKDPQTWEEVKELLIPFLQHKRYVKPGYKYVLITEFGEAMVFEKENQE